ncbi:beta-glucosidase [Catalinimonas alkaloidigena]|uniref:Beta-glucosidase n=1 Tax=Catalinimonas alkaloidigena TaxID=1075417 RepID=A0A1G9A7J4_9BACT|nr:glycoside hydrolase family 3 N-terminal domain-containing protein [Catalinimonas alkaloidigena]SDK23263.1 beta-glucosidase [Catalinimonas alkaloidigena]
MPLRTGIRRMATALLWLGLVVTTSQAQSPAAFRNHTLPPEERLDDLLHTLTLEEKISLLGFDAPAVPRLGLPAYNWWNEGLHGVARAGEATVFPQAIGLAATFDDSLMREVSTVISTEARAKYNLATRANRRLQYLGLTFWSPNVNLFRDPRWGRGQETYGEDPFLTARMGVAFVQGLQGNDPHYLKAAACAKHYAVHSGPEADRHRFNAEVDEKDLRETYLYAFRKLVDAGVESVMCAYNRVNDEPCCTSTTLLQRILRDEWHFAGHVVTDCGALQDIYQRHQVMNSPEEVAAAAIKTGVNLDCSNLLQSDVMQALQQGLLTEQDIEAALRPTLRTQLKLGFFDAPEATPYGTLGADDIHTEAHLQLARRVAQESMVLLKNDQNLLPISADRYPSIMVAGTNATSADALLGNYHGMSSQLITFAEGITEAAGPAAVVQYDQGSDYTDTSRFGGLWAASLSDLTIVVLGLTPVLEGEEGDAFLAPHGGDRTDLDIPAAHLAYLKAMRQRHDKPIVAVVTAGSAVNIAALEPYADAIVLAWYPGEQGGRALADVLFGKVSPAGRLPVTFYKTLDALPAYESYAMEGRTYRYFDGEVQYPFGYGLSYTTFAYEKAAALRKSYKPTDTLAVTVTVRNTGASEGDEVVQAYVSYPTGERMPLQELKAFRRVTVEAGQARQVTLSIPVAELQKWNTKKHCWELVKGTYTLTLGSHSRDAKVQYTFKL